MKKRIIISTITGAILGIFCVIGAQVRFPEVLGFTFISSYWFNRVLIGFVIGLLVPITNVKLFLLRGLLVGLLVSFAFYSATEYFDFIGFIAGGIYGIIIEFIAFKIK